MNKVLSNNRIVFFDGVCNLCNSTVRFIIRHDKKNRFMFAPIHTYQARFGPELPEDIPDSVVYYRNQKFYYRSRAIIFILKDLGGLWSLGYILIIIPEFISNFFYNIIARNRYKWFGKRDKCMIPDKSIANRFIS